MSEKATIERRIFLAAELRVEKRGEGDDEATVIVGLGAPFNKLSEDLGSFYEKIAPGTFKNSIKNGDPRSLFNHDPNLILGRNKNGTLELKETKEGLVYEAFPPDTQSARDVVALIERGDVDGNSFGFRTISDKWETVDGKEIRTLLEVELLDVGPVTFPAYADTEVALRSLETYRKSRHEEEEEPASRPKAAIRKRRLALVESEIS